MKRQRFSREYKLEAVRQLRALTPASFSHF